MAAKLGVSDTTVIKVWHPNGLKPNYTHARRLPRNLVALPLRLHSFTQKLSLSRLPRVDLVLHTRLIPVLVASWLAQQPPTTR